MKKEILEKVETLNEHQLNVTNEFLTNLTKETELPEIFKEKLEKAKKKLKDLEKKAKEENNKLKENKQKTINKINQTDSDSS